MAGPFFDVFLPSLAGSAAKAGTGALEGEAGGVDAALARQLKEYQLALEQMKLAQAKAPYFQEFKPGGTYQQMNPLTGQPIGDPRSMPLDPLTQSHINLNKAHEKYYGVLGAPSMVLSKEHQFIGARLFPGKPPNQYTQEDLNAIQQEDIRIAQQKAGAKAQGEQDVRVNDPTRTYDKPYLEAARALGYNPLTKPLTPEQERQVSEEVIRRKTLVAEAGAAGAERGREGVKDQYMKPMTAAEAMGFSGMIDSLPKLNTVIDRLFTEEGKLRDYGTLLAMSSKAPFTEGRELYSKLLRPFRVALEAISGKTVTEQEAQAQLDSLWPSSISTDKDNYDRVTTLRDTFANAIELMDPNRKRREFLKSRKGGSPEAPLLQPGNVGIEKPMRQQPKLPSDDVVRARVKKRADELERSINPNTNKLYTSEEIKTVLDQEWHAGKFKIPGKP